MQELTVLHKQAQDTYSGRGQDIPKMAVWMPEADAESGQGHPSQLRPEDGDLCCTQWRHWENHHAPWSGVTDLPCLQAPHTYLTDCVASRSLGFPGGVVATVAVEKVPDSRRLHRPRSGPHWALLPSCGIAKEVHPSQPITITRPCRGPVAVCMC